MYEHNLIRAVDADDFLRQFDVEPSSVRLFAQKEFNSRTDVINFLQMRMKLLDQFTAIVAPVWLPDTEEYDNLLQEMQTLGEQLQSFPMSWFKPRLRIQTKLNNTAAKIRLMEKSAHASKSLHWALLRKAFDG